jgi:hypothetical protein
MNYRQAIDEVIENLKRNENLVLNKSLIICTSNYLKFLYPGRRNALDFVNNYVSLNEKNKYHFVRILENNISASPIDIDTIEDYIIEYIFPEYKQSKNNIKFFEHTKKKSLESFDSNVNTRMAETFEPTFSPDIKVLDMNPKVIQFQIVNIGQNTYRYLLLSNGDIIKETYTSCGNFKR